MAKQPDSKHSNSIATGLSVLFLVLLLVCLAGRFWSSELAARHTGPTHIAAAGNTVLVYAAARLYRLDANGTLAERLPLARVGLDDDPIDLRLLPGRLLIAAQRPARLRQCALETWDCQDLLLPSAALPARQLKVLPYPVGRGLLYTDARGDALWWWSGSGEAPRSLLSSGTLAGPNDLAFDPHGHVWVADTDHRRLVEVKPGQGGEWETARAHSAVNDYTRAKRYFPMMLALGADGQWWVTQASEFADGRADLVTYHPENGATGQIELPQGTFATDIVALGTDLLVTDLDAYRVYRVDALSREVSLFGDAAFAGELSELHETRQRFLLLSTLAMVGVFICAALMIGAAVVATPKSRRWTPRPAAVKLAPGEVPAPEVRGVRWLKRDPRFERTLKWLESLGLVIAVILVVGMAIVFYVAQAPTAELGEAERQAVYVELGKLIALMLVLLGLTTLVLHQALKALRIRLGTDGKALHVRLHDGREFTAPAAELAWTDRVILYDNYRFPLQGGKKQRIYAEGELETWVAPLLREERRLTEWEATRHIMRQGNKIAFWVIGGLLVLIALVAIWWPTGV